MSLPAQGIKSWIPLTYYMQRGSSGFTASYPGLANSLALASVSPGTVNMRAYPFILSDGAILSKLSFEVTVLGAGGVGRIGIYTNTSDQVIYPGTLVIDGGEQSTASASVKTTSGLSIPMPPGLYWMACVFGTTGCSVRGPNASGISPLLGTDNTMADMMCLSAAFAYAALPSTFPGGFTQSASTSYALGAMEFSS